MKLNAVTSFARFTALALMVAVPACATHEQQETAPPPQPKPTTSSQPAQPKPAAQPAAMTSQAGMNTAWAAFPTGDRATSAILVEKMVPSQVVAGTPFNYQIRITNLTSGNLDNVSWTDSLPDGWTLKSANPAPAQMGQNPRWNIGTMGPKESKTINCEATLSKTGSFTSCGTVSYETGLCITMNAVQPALKLVKTATPEVLLCDSIQVKLDVTNTGTGNASNVKVTDSLPAGWTATGPTSFDAGTLASGQTKSFTFTAKADKTGSYNNTATATADGGLKVDSNTTTTVVRNCALEITKTGPGKVFAGKTITYDITVSNKGDAAATQFVIEDPIPAGTTFVSATDGGAVSGGVVRWNLGSLDKGASKKVSVTLNPTTMGTVTNTATAKAYCCGPVSASAKTEVAGIPAILLEVVDDNDPCAVGQTVTYTITVTNQGSAVGTNIKLVANLESTMEFVSTSGAVNGSHSGGTVTFAPIASLAPKASATVTVTVRAKGTGDVRFAVKMTSDQLTRSVDETESTNFYQ